MSRLTARILDVTTDPEVARLMPRWAVALWIVNNLTGNRLWRVLPYRLRHGWATEWTAGLAALRKVDRVEP